MNLTSFTFQPIPYVKVPPDEVAQLRREFKQIKPIVIGNALDELINAGHAFSQAKWIIGQCETHHIHPLSLGGKNSYSNFALLFAVPHYFVHKYIDKQIKEGKDTILIPRPIKDSRVWLCENKLVFGG